jgi:formate dehydrogenase major subunit
VLIKRTERQARRGMLAAALAHHASGSLDRRTFLRRSGLTAAGLAAVGALPLASVRKAQAAGPAVAGATIRKNVCTHCSVGCTVIAEVSNGVWVGQEPGWDSPISRGSHCAKGAATRELVHGDRRLRYPMKLVNGQWTRIAWDQAINEIGDKMMDIRAKSGAESVYWLGSAKFTNEAAYLFRKFAAFWGTNSCDHQARICHSTTVAGVANTWGYGAQTNSYTDIRNSKTIFFLGSNAAEAHPVSLQHILEGKELNRSNFIVADPRLTRTAAHATEYVRIRPGTDIPVLWGMLHHIFKNGWEDKQFIEQRVYGMDDIRKEVEKWTPEEVERVTGVPGAQLERVAKMFATEKPSTIIWAMGQTQHTVGTATVRASCILLPRHRQRRRPRHRRQHLPRPHQRAGRNRPRRRYRHAAALLRSGGRRLAALVARLGRRVRLAAVALRRAEDDEHLRHSVDALARRGQPAEGWSQKDNLKAMIVFGHGGNTVTRMPKAAGGARKARPAGGCRPASHHLGRAGEAQGQHLPAAGGDQLRAGRLAHRLQPRDAMGRDDRQADLRVEDDLDIYYLLARKLGFADRFFKNIKVENNLPVPEDVLREINRGGWSTGYCGQSPERLKLHMAHQKDFDMRTQMRHVG